jgi:hypothetical protein
LSQPRDAWAPGAEFERAADQALAGPCRDFAPGCFACRERYLGDDQMVDQRFATRPPVLTYRDYAIFR